MRALIVDDNAANLALLRALLSGSSYSVEQARHGAEALAKARQSLPDVVISDLLMPVMDGYTLLRQWKADDRLRTVPFIVYTATYTDAADERLALDLGADAFILKPAEPADFLRRLESVLEQTAGEETTPQTPRNGDEETLLEQYSQSLVHKLEQKSLQLREKIRALEQTAQEREKMESALRESEERFSKAFKSSPVAISISRLGDGRFVDVNDAFLDMFGYRREDVIGRSSLDLKMWFKPSDRQALARELQEKGGFRVREFPFPQRNGETGWTLCSAEVAQVGGEPAAVSLFVDITGRKRAEVALAETQRRLSTLVANLPGAVYRSRLDEHWTTEFISESILNITGYPAASFCEGRRRFGDLVHPEDRNRIRDEVAAAVTRRRPYELVYRIHKSTGTVQWIWEQGRAVYDTEGNAQALEGYIADITEQKQADVSIRKLNRLYSVLSSINVLMVGERDRQRLFDEVCRIAVEQGQFDLAWAGDVDTKTQEIELLAIFGAPADKEFIASTRFTACPEDNAGRGTVGEAVRCRRPACRNDLPAEQESSDWLEEFCRRGYRSVISLPVLSGGKCVSVIVLYSREPGFFDRDELQLLSELAEDVSFALAYIEQEKRVHFLAYHDVVTELGNRALLQERLEQALQQARTASHSCALVLMNINNFNDINNTLGHDNGDMVLKEVARRVRLGIWESDTIANLGGDEFAVLLPHLASSRDIDIVVRKIGHVMKAPAMAAGLPVTVDMRIGYAIFPEHADRTELLWQRAGIALRCARDLNRPYMGYEAAIDRYDPSRLALVGGIQHAMDANELVLHYQPKVDLQRGSVVGVEALLRWQHPEQGLVYPDTFIPLVERTGLINPLTTWVLAHAMRQSRTWSRAGATLDVSVNLSVRNLQNPNITKEIIDLARSSRFPLEQLMLEITESAIMVDPEHARRQLMEIHDAGIRFSLDDFGVGQSSLAYLKDLPISALKIDKSFVMGFHDPRNRALVRAAMEMGHSLGMRVTAEGIEDEATCEALRQMGCDTGQGYFISRPVSADNLVRWLKTSPWKLRQE